MSEKKTEKKKLNYILLIMNCIQYKEKAQRQRGQKERNRNNTNRLLKF